MSDDYEIYFDAVVETVREVMERYGLRGLPDDPILSISDERAMIKEMKRALRPPTREEVRNWVIVKKLDAASKGEISKTANNLWDLWNTLGPEYELDTAAILRRYYRLKKQGEL